MCDESSVRGGREKRGACFTEGDKEVNNEGTGDAKASTSRGDGGVVDLTAWDRKGSRGGARYP